MEEKMENKMETGVYGVIVITRDRKDYIRVLFYSYTTITGRSPPETDHSNHLSPCSIIFGNPKEPRGSAKHNQTLKLAKSKPANLT